MAAGGRDVLSMPRVVHLSLPSLGRQAANLASAAGRVAAAALGGDPVLASDEVRAMRTATCHACGHYLPTGRCALCGCCSGTGGLVLDKTRYATERCPAVPSKW